MGKLWMSRRAIRRRVRRKEGQREAITSRLQPPAPSIPSAKGLGRLEWKHTENKGDGMSKGGGELLKGEGRRSFGLKLSLVKGEENCFHWYTVFYLFI